jgi:ubiquinone/menaquinone biosynthesis C-methylase UbiE
MSKMSIKIVAMLAAAFLPLAACNGISGDAPRDDDSVPSSEFPVAARPVSTIGASRWSTEVERDRVKEAERAMALAEVKSGMTVADLGAGEGYYTIRLAARVGAKGRVLAQDVVPAVRDALAARVYRDKLDNVSVTLGAAADPRLPDNSFDRIFMMHMYHEVAAPYEFLWRLRPALRAGGRVVVIDSDKPTGAHGMPPQTLRCEMEALGFREEARHPMPQPKVYLAIYAPAGPRPAPAAIKPCKG